MNPHSFLKDLIEVLKIVKSGEIKLFKWLILVARGALAHESVPEEFFFQVLKDIRIAGQLQDNRGEDAGGGGISSEHEFKNHFLYGEVAQLEVGLVVLCVLRQILFATEVVVVVIGVAPLSKRAFGLNSNVGIMAVLVKTF